MKAFERIWRTDPTRGPVETVVTLVRRHRAEIGVAAAMCALAYGPSAFAPTITGDDWGAISTGDYLRDWAVRMGRWMLAVVWWLLGDNAFVPAFTVASMTVAWIAAGVLALNCMRLRTPAARVVFLGAACTYPVLVEPSSFLMLQATNGLGLLLAVASGALCWTAAREDSGPGRTLLAALLFSLAASCYQPTAPVTVMVVLLAALSSLMRDDDWLLGWTALRRLLLILLCTIFLGLGMYVLEGWIARRALDVQALTGEGHYGLALVQGLDDLSRTLGRFGRSFVRYLFIEQHLLPLLSKGVLLAAAGCLLALLWRKGGSAGTARRRWLATSLVAAVILLPWILGILRTPHGYRHNSMIGLTYVYAGLVALCIDGLRAPFLRGTLKLAAAASLVCFLFEHNRAWGAGYFLNQRDLAVASRILARIEADPAFENAAADGLIQMVVVGRTVQGGRPFRVSTTKGPLESSVAEWGLFDQDPRRLPAALEILQTQGVTYRHLARLDRAQRATLAEAMADMDAWPGPRSVRFADGELLVLVLSKSGARANLDRFSRRHDGR